MQPRTFVGIIVALIVACLSACVSPGTDQGEINTESVDDPRAYLLELINKDRTSVGLSAVTLGSNSAAQAHAEEMLEHGYVSHWGLDGLKPYTRFTSAGGLNYSAENVSGSLSPIQAGARYRTIDPIVELREAEKGFMESSGHRANILNPWHKRVNLGIACNRTSCSVVQQFEGNYVEFDERPQLTSGLFTVAGQLSDGFEFSGVQIWYDPPPYRLTLGQLDRTRCYRTGEKPVAFLNEPLPLGINYVTDVEPYTWDECSSPYEVSPDALRLASKPPATIRPASSIAPWITAKSWQVEGGKFRVQADLKPIVMEHGPGIYTVVVWGEAGGEDVALTNYSIFVGDN